MNQTRYFKNLEKSNYFNNIKSELKIIRSFLETELENYPYNCCSYATRFGNKILNLEQLSGFFYYKEINTYENRNRHCWLFDKKLKLYFDLTMDQFGDEFDKVMIIPSNTKLLKKDSLSTIELNQDNKSYIQDKSLDYLTKKYYLSK
jgi:ABC-type multidrug transport system permease subunit